MAGNPQVPPPDVFFPTRRNLRPHPQCDHESFHHQHESFHHQFQCPPQNPAFQDSRPMNPPHNNNRSVFFKTRPCKQFEKGECPHGKFCTFAHGPGDLRQPPPNWQEMVARERFGDSQWQKHKICNNFYKGEGCAYGDDCTFLHVRKEVGPQLWDSQASNCTENLGLALARPFGGIGNSNDQKTAIWKTKPCYKYEKFGRCVNGDNCQYAHEPAELKKFGGHADSGRSNIEEEVAPTKTVQELPRDALSIKTEPIFAQENHEDKKLLEWKGPKKISLIYGDWIYDHSS